MRGFLISDQNWRLTSRSFFCSPFPASFSDWLGASMNWFQRDPHKYVCCGQVFLIGSGVGTQSHESHGECQNTASSKVKKFCMWMNACIGHDWMTIVTSDAKLWQNCPPLPKEAKWKMMLRVACVAVGWGSYSCSVAKQMTGLEHLLVRRM